MRHADKDNIWFTFNQKVTQSVSRNRISERTAVTVTLNAFDTLDNLRVRASLVWNCSSLQVISRTKCHQEWHTEYLQMNFRNGAIIVKQSRRASNELRHLLRLSRIFVFSCARKTFSPHTRPCLLIIAVHRLFFETQVSRRVALNLLMRKSAGLRIPGKSSFKIQNFETTIRLTENSLPIY